MNIDSENLTSDASPVGSKKSCTSSYELRMVVVFEKKKHGWFLNLCLYMKSEKCILKSLNSPLVSRYVNFENAYSILKLGE